AQVGELRLHGIGDDHRHQVVAARRDAQRLQPAVGEEVGDQEADRPLARDPNSPEALMSTSRMTVISRSSTKIFTNGSFMRAETFQSMSRTSSPAWYWRTSEKAMPRPLNTDWYWPAS